MTFPKFEYFAPKGLKEAVSLLEKRGKDAFIMAGGTDLLIRARNREIQPKVVVGLKKIKGLNVISFDRNKGLLIGATALLADVASHPDILRYYPAIAAAARGTANVQVRNMGTLIGNLCNASPSADNAPTLLAMRAELTILGPEGERKLPLDLFFKGPGITILKPGEIATSVFIPLPPPSSGVAYLHLSARGKVDCSAIGVGAMVTMEGKKCKDARIFIGACAPIPMRAPMAEKAIIGKIFTEKLAEQAGIKASKESRPFSDVRASRAYRLKMVTVMTKRALLEARLKA